MSMIPLGASSCAHKAISWSTEQWRIFVKTWFYLCVHFCHGKYMKVHETAIFYFTCSAMLQSHTGNITMPCAYTADPKDTAEAIFQLKFLQ